MFEVALVLVAAPVVLDGATFAELDPPHAADNTVAPITRATPAREIVRFVMSLLSARPCALVLAKRFDRIET